MLTAGELSNAKSNAKNHKNKIMNTTNEFVKKLNDLLLPIETHCIHWNGKTHPNQTDFLTFFWRLLKLLLIYCFQNGIFKRYFWRLIYFRIISLQICQIDVNLKLYPKTVTHPQLTNKTKMSLVSWGLCTFEHGAKYLHEQYKFTVQHFK